METKQSIKKELERKAREYAENIKLQDYEIVETQYDSGYVKVSFWLKF